MIYVWIIVARPARDRASSRPPRWSFIAANRLRLRHSRRAGNRTAVALPGGVPPARAGALHRDDGRHHRPHHRVLAWRPGRSFPVLGGGAALVVTAALTPLMLVFGEVIPKAVAREWATALIRYLFPVIEIAGRVLAPAHLGRQRRGGPGPRPVRTPSPPNTRQFVSREELKLLLQMEPEEADVTVTEAEMIDKIFDLGETTVREVMVPLVDVAALPDDRARPTTRSASSRSAASRAFPSSPTASSTSSGWSPPWICCAGASHGADLRSLMRPGHLRPGDQAHRRSPPRDAEGPGPARGGGGRVRRRGRHRHRRGHRRGDRGRDRGRARPHPRHGGAPARRQLSRGGARAASTSSTSRWTGTCPRATSRRWPASSSPPCTASPRWARSSAWAATRSPCSRPTSAASSRSHRRITPPATRWPSRPHVRRAGQARRSRREWPRTEMVRRSPATAAHREGLSGDPRAPARARACS